MVKIKEFIRRAGIRDQEDLADRLGVKRSAVASWSSGERNPTYDTCVRLLDLGMTVEELFGKAYPSTVGALDEEFRRKADYLAKALLANIDKL